VYPDRPHAEEEREALACITARTKKKSAKEREKGDYPSLTSSRFKFISHVKFITGHLSLVKWGQRHVLLTARRKG